MELPKRDNVTPLKGDDGLTVLNCRCN
jgi:hypothetical protein